MSFGFRAASLWLLFAVTTASRLPHGVLKSSTPSDKAQLATVPAELRLTFSETPELALARIVLRDSIGVRVGLGPLTVTGNDKATIIAPVTGRFAAGNYTVEWEVAGPDGHPVRGKFTFGVLPEAIVAVALSPGIETGRRPADTMAAHHDTLDMPRSATRFDAESGGFIAVRFFLYAAMLVVIGAVAFKVLVLGLFRRHAGADREFLADVERRLATIGLVAASLLLVTCVARLGAQALALNGFDGLTSSAIGVLVTQTRWGISWSAQFGATAFALLGFAMARRSARPNTGWSIASVAAIVVAFTPAFASHAAALQRLRPLALLLDGLHVIAAAGWLGSLLALLAAGVPAALALREERRGGAVADLVNAFSPTALGFAALAGVTGLFAAWVHVGGFAPLWEDKYGKLLLGKLAVLFVLMLIGAYNWRRLKPVLGTVESAGRMQVSARTEVLVGVIVVVITAILVATPTPMDTV
ncbi:MAG: copper resistance protein CopC [Gemmatimonadaceae bacterium]